MGYKINRNFIFLNKIQQLESDYYQSIIKELRLKASSEPQVNRRPKAKDSELAKRICLGNWGLRIVNTFTAIVFG